MPPPCSTRWKYFTKGIHPSPPPPDGRTAGTPHTPVHPCSNPNLYWVQCNFCIQRNGGRLLNDNNAWLKSREEQMMSHLKLCCSESKQVYEEILEWKAGRNRKPRNTAKRDLPVAGTSASMNVNANKRTKVVSRGRRGSSEVMNLVPIAPAPPPPTKTPVASTPAITASTTATARAVALEQTKLSQSQLRHFHKVCAIAIATRNLEFNFFEDPVIMELFSILRPGMVAHGQLPTQRLLIGPSVKDGKTPGNYIGQYAMEQITSDIRRADSAFRANSV